MYVLVFQEVRRIRTSLPEAARTLATERRRDIPLPRARIHNVVLFLYHKLYFLSFFLASSRASISFSRLLHPILPFVVECSLDSGRLYNSWGHPAWFVWSELVGLCIRTSISLSPFLSPSLSLSLLLLLLTALPAALNLPYPYIEEPPRHLNADWPSRISLRKLPNFFVQSRSQEKSLFQKSFFNASLCHI